jgi:hypothetical protein
MRPHYTPMLKKRTALLRKLKESVSPTPVATDRAGDQSDALGVGELLRVGALQ